MTQRNKRRAGSLQDVMMRQPAAFSDLELDKANERLSQLYREFADAADLRLHVLARRIDILQKIVHRLRISLHQTNKPFEGGDAFQKTLSACEIGVQCFRPPSGQGQQWTCNNEYISVLGSTIVTEIYLQITSIVVLIAETVFYNEDRDPTASTQSSQSTSSVQVQPNDDPDIELFKQFWENIVRLVYGRKRAQLRDTSRIGSTPDVGLDVTDKLRQLMLNNAKVITGERSSSESRDVQNSHRAQSLNLDALSDQKLLEVNQQHERLGRAVFGRRSEPDAAQVQRIYTFTPILGRVYTLASDHDDADPQSPEFALHDGTLYIDNTPPYKLASIECRLINKKRMVKCITANSTPITIIHDLPLSSSRFPRTTHRNLINNTTPHVAFYEHLNVKIGTANYSSLASIRYKFDRPDESIVIFQGMIRDKDLIKVFSFDTVESALNHIEAANQHLKFWKDHKTGNYTFSFFRSGTVRKTLECAPSWFEILSAKQSRSNRHKVRLDFDDKPGSLTRQEKQMKNDAASVEFLIIEFSSSREASDFKREFKKLQDDAQTSLPFRGSEASLRRSSRTASVSQFDGPWDLALAESRAPFHAARLNFQPPSAPPIVDHLLDALISPPPRLGSTPEPHAVGLTKATQKSYSASDYTVGWICALWIECSAAIAILDEEHPPLPQHELDTNAYKLGRVGDHNVVIACLPMGMTGTTSATTVAGHMAFNFRRITTRLMVGIGGGVPSPNNDIRLGDVVVSKPGTGSGGIVQYDFGKETDGGFEKTGWLPGPPTALLAVVSVVEARHGASGSQIPEILEASFNTELRREKFHYPGRSHDELFQADCEHPEEEPTCEKCDRSRLVDRPERSTATFVHYGTIGSGNRVMKNGTERNKIARKHDLLCFEMEAAGLMGPFPCLVIRGICDYADAHKNKEWQPYAAAVAAAYAKELLLNIPPTQR